MEVPKKLLNSVDSCVDEALSGIVSSNSGLSLLKGHRVVVRSDLETLRNRVALVSGGGSGHEPAHAGYVGAGMLSAAVAGSVFASPPPSSVLAAILTLRQAGASGVLLIVKNYTGDRLNFGLALEQARARGVPVAMVIVADDCAFVQPSKAGRRGLCGTLLIHKMAGALAEEGRSLDEIVNILTETVKDIGTLGVSMSPCSVPGCVPSFELPPGEMELGLGIHGEAGIQRLKIGSADEVVKIMIDHMTNPTSQSHLPLNTETMWRIREKLSKTRENKPRKVWRKDIPLCGNILIESKGDTVVLCVNNLGALSCLEMAVVTRAALTCLEGRGVRVTRVMSGTFMTSLEMTGVSLTLMRTDEERLRLFDAKTTAPSWPNLSHGAVSGRNCIVEPPKSVSATELSAEKEGPLSAVTRRVLEAVCTTLLNQQEELNTLDRASGDGDCGNTHVLAARAIQEWIHSHVIPGCPGKMLAALAGLVQEHMGGSSGALYSLFLTAAATPLSGRSDSAAWADALRAGTEAMRRYGGADPGDRTMLDALYPALDELRKLSEAPSGGEMAIWQAAVQKAESGAESTRSLTARAGRASYVAAERVTLPDPGAVAVASILRTVIGTLGKDK